MKKGELPIGIFFAAIVFTVAAIAFLLASNVLPKLGRSTPSVVTAVGSDISDADSYSLEINAISFLRSEEDGLEISAHLAAFASCTRSGSDCSALSLKLDSYADKYLLIYEEPRRCISVELRDNNGNLVWEGRQSKTCIFARSAFSTALHKEEIIIPTDDPSSYVVFVQKRAFS